MLRQKIYIYVPWKFDRLGGVDVIVDNIFKAGIDQSLDVSIAEQSWESFAQTCDSDGRIFVTFNLVAPPNGTGLQRIRSLASFAKHAVKALYQLKSQQVNVINVHFPTNLVYMLCVFKYLRLWDGKLVLSFHGSDVNAVAQDDKIWSFIFKMADDITVCSHALKSKLLSRVSAPQLPIQVIHNGIDTDYMTNCLTTSSNQDFSVEGEYILCVANFVENKGQDILIRAFAVIVKNYPDLKLVLAGGRDNGLWVGRLKEIAVDLKIEQSLLYLFDVPHENIPALMRDATMLVLPSRYESFGLVIAESGLVATPVIASNVGGIPEIILSSDYGTLVPVNNVNSLVDAIDHFIKFPEKSSRTAYKLQERIINNFCSKEMCNQYIRTY